jgi:hypothetical protein
MKKQMTTQKKIMSQLKSLEELNGISVNVTGSKDGTIRISHTKLHALEFRFHWSGDHFIGHFIDGDDNESQAVISLYSRMDAIRFITAYNILNDVRANQKA